MTTLKKFLDKIKIDIETNVLIIDRYKYLNTDCDYTIYFHGKFCELKYSDLKKYENKRIKELHIFNDYLVIEVW